MALVNDNNELTFGGLVNVLQNFEDATAMSLSQYAKKSTIMSRVFLQHEIAGEEGITDLMLVLMNIYGGFIFTAFDMNRFVTGSKRVRDLMSVVATEGFDECIDGQAVDVSASIANHFGMPNLFSPEMIRLVPNDDPLIEKRTNVPGGNGASIVELPKNLNLPSGRVLQVKFGDPRGQNPGFTINLYLQLFPKIIPRSVAEQFVSINFTPSLKQRWMQVTAGEIDFINDLVMSRDLLKKRRQALKNDKDNILKGMLDRQENSLHNAWLKLIQYQPERQNIANTIMILDERDFGKFCNNAGMNFNLYSSRQAFFNKTFTMILCTVNPMNNVVKLYFHGMDVVGTYSLSQLKQSAQRETYDLSTIMKAFGQGNAPKF